MESNVDEYDCSVMLTWFMFRPASQSGSSSGRWIFRFSSDNVVQSRLAASHCHYFMADDEDEMLDDKLLSCVNCMRRRWLVDGFECYGLPSLNDLIKT